MMRTTRTGRALTGLGVAVICAALVGGATAVPPQSGVIDLLTDGKQRIDGAGPGHAAGTSVAVAGDVNGDGRLDVVVGANRAGNTGHDLSGSAYVVFGGAFDGPVDLAALGPRGFRLDGNAAFDQAGWSVSPAGDANGDGKSDVVVGVPWEDNNGREDSGTAYVVYGTTSTQTVDLATLGDRGFRIDGAEAGDTAGSSVAYAGDVNGDGRGDLVVGAPTGGILSGIGAAYVVFGTATPGNVDLASLGSRGFSIEGTGRLGDSVSRVGDMNGDGMDDLVLGAHFIDSQKGAAYVVFGKATTTMVDVTALSPSDGFRIDGAAPGDNAGDVVAGAGDVNGDARPDILLGARDASNNGRTRSGSAYVVFGKQSSAPISLAALGDGGFRLDGATAEDRAGMGVSGAGDVNGDGRADVLVGAPTADNNGRDTSGSAYVVFGKATTATVDLGQLGTGGYRLDAPTRTDWLGEAVFGGGGDVTGDGVPDILIGAPRAIPNVRGDEGAVHVFGFGQPRLSYGGVAATVGVAVLQPPTQVERTGAATFQVSPPLPAGLTLDAAGRVAGTPTATHGPTVHTVTMEDLVGVATAQLSVAVTAPVPPPPALDRTRPRVVLKAAARQRVVRQKRVLVRASCNEACTLRAVGSIAILGTRVRIPLRATGSSRGTAAERTLGLALTKASVTRLSGFLAKGRRARATVTVTARDLSGNVRPATVAIAVRR